MKSYEYIRIVFDFGDLSLLNKLSRAGWRVVLLGEQYDVTFILLEREIDETVQRDTLAGVRSIST